MRLLSIFFLAPVLAWAQINTGSAGDPNANVMVRDGQLLTVRLVVGEPLRIFVVGKEEAKLDLSKLKLTVRRVSPYPGKVLSLNRTDNSYSVVEPLDLKTPTDLEVTTQIKNKKETLKFKIDGQKP